MSQQEDRRFSEGSKTPGTQNSPAAYKTYKAQTSPTNQHLPGDNISPSSQSPGSAKHHDYEAEHSPQKKSVFTKVKEKAKKLRHSLSNKRRHGHDNDSPSDNTAPPWGVSSEDNDDREEPEYLGAPMYESEMAPENLKETAREHPREVHVPSEKHVVESSVKNDVKKQESCQSPNKIINNTSSQKVAPMSENIAPAHAAGPDATNSTASEIAGLTIDTPASEHPKNFVGTTVINPQASEAGKLEQDQATSQHTWDKGVKEYLMQKLEPGEDERALSQVITETMSPRKFSGDQIGMVEKMKEAVNSFLQAENAESISLTKTTNSSTNIPNSTNPNSLSNISTTTIKTTPSPLDHVYTIEAKTSAQNPIFNAIKTNSSSGTNTTSGTANTNSYSNVPSSTADMKPSSYVPPISTNSHEVTGRKLWKDTQWQLNNCSTAFFLDILYKYYVLVLIF